VMISDRDPKFVNGLWHALWRRYETRFNMSFNRHPDGLTERVNNTFQHLPRFLCCYDGITWTCMLPQVEFAYNATRALGIERTPFETNFGFSVEEDLDQLFSMRSSIPVSRDVFERLRLFHKVHAMARSMLKLDKDEMQVRSEPSTAPHFVRGGKVTIITNELFLRGQPNMKLRERQLGLLTVEEQLGKHKCSLKLPVTISLHPVFHVNNLRPAATCCPSDASRRRRRGI
jgi:hypothetical protein